MLSVYNKLFCFAFIKQVKCILKYYSKTGNLLDVEGKNDVTWSQKVLNILIDALNEYELHIC